MSADLFAEFGPGSTSTQASGHSRQESNRSQANSLIPDLEAPQEFPSANPWSVNPPPRKAQHSDRPHALGNQPPQRDDNVLFDATVETVSNDGSEDWGEFESAETLPAQSQPTCHTQEPDRGPNLIDSLSIEDEAPSVGVTSRNATTGSAQAKTGHPAPANRVEAPQDESFDDWGEFIDGPLSRPSTQAAGKKVPEKRMVGEGQSRSIAPAKSESGISKPQSKSTDHASTAQIRPTNIPPPSVLLQMFLQLFEQLGREARAKRNTQDNAALEDTAIYVACSLKTTARVVAGRTLRWKRDSILSQSMRIGPARSGKPGGMKLNTVNKNENVKEQQEAVDVLAMWRDRTALFNSVLQASGQRPIPVIAENARVTTATSAQGAIKRLMLVPSAG
ncbi:hypothetical protein PHISP_07085 [Aspergillus sp. HF37]|nr:hypothetical protein PHISP_07085 [Aspergillus sp. HF37]